MKVQKGKRTPASGSVHVNQHPKGILKRGKQKRSIAQRRVRKATELEANPEVLGEETDAPDERANALGESKIAVEESQ